MSINIAEYIASGVVYDYCMGLLSPTEEQEVVRMAGLYPEVSEEISAVQAVLEGGATTSAKKPPGEMKDKIWGVLENMVKEQVASPDDLPVVNKYSNADNWRRMVSHLIPLGVPEGMDVQMLRQSEGVTQMLVTSSIDVPDEVHENEIESFLVLEGECMCYIGDEQVKLSAGGYIEIPLHVHHNVVALTPRVVAVLQLVAV